MSKSVPPLIPVFFHAFPAFVHPLQPRMIVLISSLVGSVVFGASLRARGPPGPGLGNAGSSLCSCLKQSQIIN